MFGFKSTKPADIVCIINGILEETCSNSLSRAQSAETIRRIAELRGKGLRIYGGPEEVVCHILAKTGILDSSGDFYSIQNEKVAGTILKCQQNEGSFVHA